MRPNFGSIESQGADLITRHWLGVFGLPPCDWVGDDFERRLRMLVRKVIADGSPGDRPGDYTISRHFQTRATMELNWRNRFQMRFRGEFACWKNPASNSVHLSVAAFARSKTLSAPPTSSHFRFFLYAGAMCDFTYDELQGRYTPLHPEVIGRCNVAISPMTAFADALPQGLQLDAALPAHLQAGAGWDLVAGFGVEFWRRNDRGTGLRFVDRVMVIG